MSATVVKVLLFLVIYIRVSQQSTNCTCVPFYQCSDEDNIISDGRGLIEQRNDDDCQGIFEVCCNTTTPSPTTPLPTAPKGCGYHSPSTFPWTSTLLYRQYPKFVPSFKCRTSLIHPQVAVTAAHCIQDKGYYHVRIGNTIRSVSQLLPHPQFSTASLHNDIAALVLSKPFKVGKTGTVCIPPPGMVLGDANCTTATKLTKGEEGEVKVMELPVVPQKECEERLRGSRLGKFFRLHDSFVCAGGEEGDTCEGDGGSPLICPIPGVPGRYHQAGIVSWGIECGGGLPGVYVNLSAFRDWLDDILEKNGFDTSFYKI